MTSIDPVAAATITTAGAPSQDGMLAGLGSEGFLDLLVAQLRYQNPMAPSDPTAMLQQTSQLAQVETLNAVAASQRALLAMQEATLASGLVGDGVTYRGADGEDHSGVVDAVRFDATGPVLVVGDDEVPLAATTELRAGA